MDIYKNLVNNYRSKKVTFQGKPHIVVPAIMMIEGVHSGSHGPLLHLASDLGMFPESWNGIPVTVTHPANAGGNNISANDNPEISEKVTVGRVFNTHMDGLKLKADVYIDEEKIKQTSPEALTYIRQGRPLDVSVGVFTEEEQSSGTHNGEQYVSIARHHRPDHLALLPGEQGACSWADGCGIRANKEKSIINNENAIENEKMNEDEIKAERLAILERLSKTSIAANAAKGFKDLLDKVSSMVNSMDNQTEVYYLEEVFDGNFIYRKRVRNNPNNGGVITEEVLLQQAYNVLADGTIDLVGNPTKVKKDVTYTVINNNKEPHKMVRTKNPVIMAEEKKPCGQCMEKVVAIINNKQSGFTAEHREWLLTQEESILDVLLARTVEETPVVQANKEQVIEDLKTSIKTPEDFIKLAPAEMQESMRSGLALHKQNKANLVKKIMDNSEKGVWSEVELNAMAPETLEKIGKSIKLPVDYSGNGGAPVIEVNVGQEEVLLPCGVKEKAK